MNGAHLLVKILEEQGVDVVFGYPGGTVLSIYDALYQERKRIRHIRTAHEQGAAHAADGYARASGKTGVCIATSGPGATNLVTGIANAYMDSIPTVFITGNVELPLIGTDSFQEVDITGITLSVTKHNHMVKTPEELGPVLRDAFRIANMGRKGPVLVDIPRDILEGKIQDTAVPSGTLPERLLDFADTWDDRSVQDAALLISQSKYPLILVGGGVRMSDASAEVLRLAEKIGAPICSSLMATGEIPYSHELYLGNLGVYGSESANEALGQCDLLIAVGTRFSNRLTAQAKISNHLCKMIHIDTDRAEINKIVTPDCYIVGDAKIVTDKLSEMAQAHQRWYFTRRNTQCDAYLMALREICGEDAYIVTDVGLHQMWVAGQYPFENKGRFITSGGLGTMGFGLGAAIGVQTAQMDKPVILITGDGSFQMNCNELATVYRQKLPIIVLVMNNGQLGMVHSMQKEYCRGRYSETILNKSPNFAALARAFHIKGFRVNSVQAFREALRSVQGKRIPAVIEIHIGRNAEC